MNSMQLLVKKICEEKGITFSLVSKDWIMVLEKENMVRYISGYKFGINDHAVGQVCEDKYALYDVLKLFSFPLSEYYILFSNYKREEVFDYFQQNGNDIVVKINEGTCGNGIYHVTNEDELFSRIDELLSKHHSISLSPFYSIQNEYRSIIVDGRVELFYGKKRPIVVGDGEKTVYELLCEFNPSFFTKLKDHSELDFLLEKGMEYEYNWQHNLSRGAIPFYEEDSSLKEKIQTVALSAAEKLNLRFASVDIIHLESGEVLILEVNSGVMMDNFSKYMDDGEEIAKRIYSKVIDKMFEE